jgi:hypothetical protein
MTALEYFEKLKKISPLDENADYDEWIEERINKGLPVEGDLIEAYSSGKFVADTFNKINDHMTTSLVKAGAISWVGESKKASDEPTKTQVRFIKNAKK